VSQVTSPPPEQQASPGLMGDVVGHAGAHVEAFGFVGNVEPNS
jgi:hypothetical protein